MRRLYLLALLVASALPAQTTQWIRAGAGIEQAAQRNSGESPYAYSGWGPAATLGYTRDNARGEIDVLLRGGYQKLHSNAAPGDVTHATLAADVRYLRVLPGRFAATRWMLGANASFLDEAAQHHYRYLGLDDIFAYSLIGMGPAVRSEWSTRAGTIGNELHVPLVNWIAFPYTDLKSDGLGLHYRFASPSAIRSLDDAVTYHAGAGGGRHVTWTYRISYFRYQLIDLRRFARQSLDIALNIPIGDAR